MNDTARPTIVLVHGAWHGPWCWDDLRLALHVDGWQTSAPQLPSASLGASQPTAGLREDVASLLDHVDEIAGPVALVGHSYAGMPVTEVAALRPDKVSQLIYVAAYLPQIGDSLYSIHGLPVPEDTAGTVAVPDDPITMFYADVDHEIATAAAARLRPQTLRSWTEPVEHAQVGAIGTAYLLCNDDQALPTSLQETFAARTARVERLDSGHSPFLSQPQELAAHLGHLLSPV